MASPVWKIYLHKEYRASCKRAEDAAALVAFLGDGAQIRWDHAFVAWTEGKESQPAAESYDHVAAVAQARVQEMQAKRYAEQQARTARVAAEWKARKDAAPEGLTVCEMCDKDQPNCGPFRNEKTGEAWASVCGGCKIRYALAQPGVKEGLEQDAKRAMLAALNPTRGKA